MLEVQRYVQFADIAICCQPDTPTVRAASNMKVFQYMAMGSVPVVSNVGDLAQYVQQGQAGAVVAADDTAELAATIVGLLQDPTRRTQLATTAYQLAQNEYSWQNLTNRLTALLATLVTAKSGKAKL
jgi:glycosyltransferase involved in cell wall biosynthesis